MHTEHTHLFWIDADIGFTPEQALRLLLAGRDVVAGVYPLERIDWTGEIPAGLTQAQFLERALRYPVNLHDGARLEVDDDGFMKVDEAPTGFMCIRRAVLETMIARMPELRYVPDAPPDSPLHGYCHRFFDGWSSRKPGAIFPRTTRFAAAGGILAERCTWMHARHWSTTAPIRIAAISARRWRTIRRKPWAGNERTARERSRRGAQASTPARALEPDYFFSVDEGVGVGNGNVLNIDFACDCICSCICTNMFFDCSM